MHIRARKRRFPKTEFLSKKSLDFICPKKLLYCILYSTMKRDILHIQSCLINAVYKWEIHNEKIEIISFVVKVRW
jgi:hypothetical protein